MMSDEHARIFPGSGVASDKTTAGEWQTTKGGGYHATAVGANVTGRRGDILIGDDLLSGIEAAESDRERAKLWSWWAADLFTRRKNQDTPIILIQTRWHLGDLMGRLDDAERQGDGAKKLQAQLLGYLDTTVNVNHTVSARDLPLAELRALVAGRLEAPALIEGAYSEIEEG